MLDRVYCPDPILDGRAAVEGDEARHLARVRRASIGDAVELFDGRGHRSRAEVAAVGRDRVELAIVEGPIPGPAPSIDLTLATAVPKGERFDWLVEKATELGVARLIPLRTERSVVDPGASKIERLRRVVIEACKQCGRDRLMELTPTADWSELLAVPGPGPRWLAHPGGGQPGTGEPLAAAGSVLVAVGPEGGWTDAEVAESLGRGWDPIGLGPTILRVETAAIVAAAIVLAKRWEVET